jgi:hypothetical protein
VGCPERMVVPPLNLWTARKCVPGTPWVLRGRPTLSLQNLSHSTMRGVSSPAEMAIFADGYRVTWSAFLAYCVCRLAQGRSAAPDVFATYVLIAFMEPRTFPTDENGYTFTRLPNQHHEVAFSLFLALRTWKMPALKRRLTEDELRAMGSS